MKLETEEIANTGAASCVQPRRTSRRLRNETTGEVRHLTPTEAATHPCPASSYPAHEQKYIESSLRAWTKSVETHTTDQNYLCIDRMSRFRTNGKILPVSQTAALWQMVIPPIVLEPLFVNLGTTREDVRAITELGRKYIERLRLANQRTGIEPGWTKELQKEWDTHISNALRKPAEIVKVKIVGRKRLDADRRAIHEEERRYQEGFVADEDVCDSFEGLHITSEGVRGTTDHTDLEELRRWWIAKYNPRRQEWTAELVKRIQNHPDFETDKARLLVEFRALTIEEVVSELGLDVQPNTLTQRLVRGKKVKNRYAGLPISDHAASHFVCIVILNGRASLKILCSGEASPEQVKAALETLREKSVRIAVKNAKRDGLSEETICEAIDRINKAYQDSHVMYWLGSDDREDRFVINPPIDEGEQLVLNQTREE